MPQFANMFLGIPFTIELGVGDGRDFIYLVMTAMPFAGKCVISWKMF